MKYKITFPTHIQFFTGSEIALEAYLCGIYKEFGIAAMDVETI